MDSTRSSTQLTMTILTMTEFLLSYLSNFRWDKGRMQKKNYQKKFI